MGFMSGIARLKRVTDPLDDNAKARIIGREGFQPDDYVSSGSEHSAHYEEDDVTSSSFTDLIFGFNDGVNEIGEKSHHERTEESDSELDLCKSIEANVDLLKPILENQNDAFKNALWIHVLKGLEVFSYANSNRESMRRNLMAFLRGYGYNAAICKTKWSKSGGLSAGEYEFIDVIRSENSVRYFVDLDFCSEFEIARPTSSYERVLQCLPRVFVGEIDDLKRILRIVSESAKRSLKCRGLHLPPWRKHRFVVNKWFGPYRRTVNIFPASFGSASPEAKQRNTVKCRAVGFEAVSSAGDNLLFPGTVRT